MTLELFADTPVIIGQSWSVLSAPYTAGATVLAVVSNTPYPTADPTASPATVFRVRVDNEILLVTDSRTLSWTVAGAQEGSSAANHAVGALVVVPFTKGSVAGVVAAAAVDATTKVATETSRATAAEATNAAAVTAEATARASADSTLTTNLASETTRASTAEALKVAKAGDTMTGPLVLPGNPSTALQAAPKQYVDTSITNLINGAPGILDTLGEIATQLQSDESVAGALATTVANETTRATTAEAGKAQKLTRTAVKTANYTAAAGDLVPCDTTSAAFTVTLPNAPAVGSRVAVKIVTLGAGNAVTIACAGSDVFNKTAGATTGTLTLLNQALQVQYDSGGIWTVVADDIPKSQLDATYPSLDGSSRLAIGGVELTPNQIGGIGPGSPTLTGSPTIRANASGAVTPILNFDAFGRDWQIGIDTSNDGGGRSLFVSKFVQRTISDLVTTNTSTAVTSATQARFGPNDNGTAITGAGIPAGTTLVWVRGTDTLISARLSQAATATASGVTATIGSDPAAVQDLFFFRDNGGNGSALGIGVTPPTGSHRLEVGGSDGDTTQGGIRIRVGPSQTGTALSVYDSGGTEQYSIDSAFYANQVRIRGASGGRLTTLATNDLANSWGWDIDGTQGKGVLALRYLTTAHDALYAGTDGSIRIVTKLIADTVTANAQLTITSPATGTITAVFKRLSGQTKGLVVCRDESNNFLASIDQNGLLNWATANQATGAGSAALGTNCPAVTATAPNTWLKVVLADGSTAYLPAWK